MRKLPKAFFSFLCLASSAFGLHEASSEEEALSLRRISDFWEEEEFSLAEKEINTFFTLFPESPNCPFLHAILGDLLLKEKEYEKALAAYDLAGDPSDPNRFFSLLQGRPFSEALQEGRALLQEEGLAPEKRREISSLLALRLAQECGAVYLPEEEIYAYAKEALSLLSELPRDREELKLALACVYNALHEFEKGAEIYSELAEGKEGSAREELLFQSALLAAKHSPEKALALFDVLAEEKGALAKEASFNRLALLFGEGKMELLLEKKESFLSEIPEEKQGAAHLLLARAFLSQGLIAEAGKELSSSRAKGVPLKEALYWQIEAGEMAQDPSLFEEDLGELPLEDPTRIRGELLRLHLRKKEGEPLLQELKENLPRFLASPYREEALLLELELLFSSAKWVECREKASSLQDNPTAFEYLVYSLARLSEEDPQYLPPLAEILEETKREDFSLLRAKTLYALGKIPEALAVLSSLPEEKSGDAHLLRALCLKESRIDDFFLHAEKALSLETTLWDKKGIHLALFNTYLEQGEEKKGAEHLLSAFALGAPLQKENALWLVDLFFPDPKIAPLLLSLAQEGEEEQPLLKLAELSLLQGDRQEALRLLEKVEAMYTARDSRIGSGSVGFASNSSTSLAPCSRALSLAPAEKSEAPPCHLSTLESPPVYGEKPEAGWKGKEKMLLLKGKVLAEAGAPLEEVLSCFDAVLNGASSSLEERSTARLAKAELLAESGREGALDAALVELKTLALQKYLPHEPIHLEAALAYASLQATPEKSAERRAALWEKLHREFSEEETLLGKDYQAALSLFPEKKELVSSYLSLFEAEKLLAEGEASASLELGKKGRGLLEKLQKEAISPSLKARVEKRIEAIDRHETPPS